MWDLTLPQLNYYLRKCRKHVEFTVKVQTLSFSGLFGGAGTSEPTTTTTSNNGKEIIDGYEVANLSDIDFFASLL